MTPPPVTLSKLIPPQEKIEPETDRHQLKAGDRFVLTDVLVAPSKKFEKFSKLNGYDLISGQRVKHWTTSGPIIGWLELIIEKAGIDESGHLKQEIKLHVVEKVSEKGRKYLTFEYPA